jgi:hypothetical protein
MQINLTWIKSKVYCINSSKLIIITEKHRRVQFAATFSRLISDRTKEELQ